MEDQINIKQTAVGQQKTSRDMYIYPESNLNTLNTKKSGYIDKKQVTVESLPNILKNTEYQPSDIDVLRMDIEGYEVEALKGIQPIYQEIGEVLMNIEIHPVLLTQQQNQYLKKLLTKSTEQIYMSAQADKQIQIDSIEEALEYGWIELVLQVDLNRYNE